MGSGKVLMDIFLSVNLILLLLIIFGENFKCSLIGLLKILVLVVKLILFVMKIL